MLLAWLALLGCSPSETPTEEPRPAQDTGMTTAAWEQETVADLISRAAPGSDDWETERKGALVGDALQQLGEALEHPERTSSIAERLAARTFRSTALRPELVVVLDPAQGAAARVLRQADDTAEEPDLALSGPAGLAQGLEALLDPFEPCTERWLKFKVTRVEPSGSGALGIVARYQAGGRHDQGSVAQRAVWHMRFSIDGAQVRLTEARVAEFEEVLTTSAGGRFLRDSTGAVLGDSATLNEQLAFGLDHWSRHIERIAGIGVFRHAGLAIGDANGDGLEDLYVCQYAGLPNRLYVQRIDGTAMDVTETAGVGFLDHSSSALLVDLDGDGDHDLAVATQEGLVLCENDGDGHFQQQATLHSQDRDVYALSAVDHDGDGDLDLYVTLDFASAATRRAEKLPRFEYVNANDGAANHLFENRGGWRFADVTQEVGLDVNNHKHSLAAAWADYDDDGDMDLYVANDYGWNNLYVQEQSAEGRPRFVDRAAELGVTDAGSGMSAAWGDYDRDGRLDLYVSNMFSSAGNRVTTQARFLAELSPDERARYLRFAKGNTLFRQNEGGSFTEVEGSGGAQIARWAWGAGFCDLDGDGWQDFLVANGYVTTEDTGDL